MQKHLASILAAGVLFSAGQAGAGSFDGYWQLNTDVFYHIDTTEGAIRACVPALGTGQDIKAAVQVEGDVLKRVGIQNGPDDIRVVHGPDGLRLISEGHAFTPSSAAVWSEYCGG